MQIRFSFVGIGLTLLVGALCAPVSFAQTSAATTQVTSARWQLQNTPAPALSLTDQHSKTWDLAALKGRVVIVNFWATWCAPCVAEMPSLQAFAQTHGDTVTVLAVNYHESAAKIAAFGTQKKLHIPLLRDPWQETSAAWGVKFLPASFVIDRAGLVRYRVDGEMDWTATGVLDTLKTAKIL